jgi:hypothetical protein
MKPRPVVQLEADNSAPSPSPEHNVALALGAPQLRPRSPSAP